MSEPCKFHSLSWRKSTASGADGCVEVAPFVDGIVAIRDSKDPNGASLAYTPHEWRSFLAGVRNGEFDDLTHEPMLGT
jgi:hypothetical protein